MVIMTTALKPNELTPEAGVQSNEDEIIFGSMNQKLADTLADRIRDAINRSLETLPLLSDPEKSTYLQETIQEKYMRSVDVIEAYGSRNIFTVRQHPLKHRQQIVAALRQSDEKEKLSGTSTNGNNTSKTKTSAKLSKSSFQYPSREDIPSAEDMASIQACFAVSSVMTWKNQC